MAVVAVERTRSSTRPLAPTDCALARSKPVEQINGNKRRPKRIRRIMAHFIEPIARSLARRRKRSLRRTLAMQIGGPQTACNCSLRAPIPIRSEEIESANKLIVVV